MLLRIVTAFCLFLLGCQHAVAPNAEESDTSFREGDSDSAPTGLDSETDVVRDPCLGSTPPAYCQSVDEFDSETGTDSDSGTGASGTDDWDTGEDTGFVPIDNDGDGWYIPFDCDDANPSIHLDALDIPANGIDEDCDGEDAILVVDTEEPDNPCLGTDPPQWCTPIKTVLFWCGNGHHDVYGDGEAGEYCDDGNTIPGDGCNGLCEEEDCWDCLYPGEPCVPTCFLEWDLDVWHDICGDSMPYGSEEPCDDTHLTGYYGTCAPGCQYAPHCGDGIVQPEYEQCDAGADNGGLACGPTCHWPETEFP